MIVVTGACGFIGSCLVSLLNDQGINNLILVDDFTSTDKNKNILNKSFDKQIHRQDFISWFSMNYNQVDEIYHIGARTDTSEVNQRIFDDLNLNYSKDIWKICSSFNIPIIYASSAATYGLCDSGYLDDESNLDMLRPLNAYAQSKHDFDRWVITQGNNPGFWAGFKFFNVYGPNEYHKSRMASVVFHAFNSIQKDGSMRLFRSHNLDYKDGYQSRDFIYVKDVVSVLFSMMQMKRSSGIYNLGTGHARSFLDLTKSVYISLNKTPNISFIDTPKDIRETYQYFTQANMSKLLSVLNHDFYSLEDGISDYVDNYLLQEKYL